MPGWNLKSGPITNFSPGEDYLWSLFNYVFSDACSKRNTYKFGIIKSFLDNAFNGMETNQGVFYTYSQIFGRFAENYWNLVVKYNLRQMRPDGKSVFSKIETILRDTANYDAVFHLLEFNVIDNERRTQIIKRVTEECKRYVIGALYQDFDGVIYKFDLSENGLILNKFVYDFMLKYKSELEKLNYYSWAKFLERVNDDSCITHILDKLEYATPRRNDLSIYREILRKEFEENTCFYCGKKLGTKIHVDHFIPWSFVKDDKLWNFVLSCPTCNEKKNDRLPKPDFIVKVKERNKIIKLSDNSIIQSDFKCYSDDLLNKMWQYAKISGLKIFNCG